MTLSERIASEIMDTIERERRINKDDLVAAAERAIQQWEKEEKRQHPLMTATELTAEAEESFRNFVKTFPNVFRRPMLPPASTPDEAAIVEVLPSYFRPKPPPTRFGTPTK